MHNEYLMYAFGVNGYSMVITVMIIPTSQAHGYLQNDNVTSPCSSISLLFLEINETYICLCEGTSG